MICHRESKSASAKFKPLPIFATISLIAFSTSIVKPVLRRADTVDRSRSNPLIVSSRRALRSVKASLGKSPTMYKSYKRFNWT